MRKFAVIDLGSNSVRMNLVEAEDGHFSITAELKQSVRLSEGMGPEKTLKPYAVERTLAALQSFADTIRMHKITEIHAVATAAVRQAQNPEVITEPLREMGIEIEVISGEQEAYYDFLGVIHATDLKDFVIADIGGASTEVILVQGGKYAGLASIPCGAVNLTEGYLQGERADKAQLEAAFQRVREELSRITFLDEAEGLPVVGLGGSARTIGKVERARRKKYDAPLQHFELSDNDFFALRDRILVSTLAQRNAVEGISKTRAEVIVGGLIPLCVLFERTDALSFYVSTKGLRDGLMYDVLTKRG